MRQRKNGEFMCLAEDSDEAEDCFASGPQQLPTEAVSHTSLMPRKNNRKRYIVPSILCLVLLLVWARYGEYLMLNRLQLTTEAETTISFDGRRHYGRDASFMLRYEPERNLPQKADKLSGATQQNKAKDEDAERSLAYNYMTIERGLRYCTASSMVVGSNGRLQPQCASSCVGSECYKILNDPRQRSDQKNIETQALDVTLAMHGTINQLGVIRIAFEAWRGAKTIIFYVPSNEMDAALSTIAAEIDIVSPGGRLSPLRDAVVAVFSESATSPETQGGGLPGGFKYPSNVLRNIAMDLTRTEFVLPLDAGAIPSANAYSVISSLLAQMEQHGARVAFVLPVFESLPCPRGMHADRGTALSHIAAFSATSIHGDNLMPTTDAGLLELWQSGHVRPSRCDSLHAPSSLKRMSLPRDDPSFASARAVIQQCGIHTMPHSSEMRGKCVNERYFVDYQTWSARLFGRKSPSLVLIATNVEDGVSRDAAMESYVIFNIRTNRYRIPRFHEPLSGTVFARSAHMLALSQEGFHFYAVDTAFVIKTQAIQGDTASTTDGIEAYSVYTASTKEHVQRDKDFAMS